MGLHTNDTKISSSDVPLKSAISGSKGIKVASGGPKRVRFSDEEQVRISFTNPYNIFNVLFMLQSGSVVKKIKDENHLEISTNQGCSPSPLHIRPSMLDLDDLPEELIPIHHKKIKQQVS